MLDSLSDLVKSHGDAGSIDNDTALSVAMPLINRITKDGSVFLVKADGERESNVYTIVINAGHLRDDYLKAETSELSKGLYNIISEYCNLVWKNQPA